MALIGRIETRPTSTTSVATYQVVVVRCLLCGEKSTFHAPMGFRHTYGDKVVANCQCYDDAPGGPHQPVRIVPNDR